jgi:hypothetical protein
MAKIIRREWTSTGPLGKRVRHVAFGYTLTINGKRERKFSSAWVTEAAAHEALTQRLKEVEAGLIEWTQKPKRTLRELSQEYLAYKVHEGNAPSRMTNEFLRIDCSPTSVRHCLFVT